MFCYYSTYYSMGLLQSILKVYTINSIYLMYFHSLSVYRSTLKDRAHTNSKGVCVTLQLHRVLCDGNYYTFRPQIIIT